MTYAFSQRSLSFCTHVDARTMQLAQYAIAHSTQDFGFTEGQSRTKAEQQAKVDQGYSKTMHSHHIIDCEPAWAAPGFSGAIDCVPWTGTAYSWDWNLIYPIASAFWHASKALGIPMTWGGDFSRLITEIPGDGSAAALKAHQLAVGGFDGPHMHYGRN